jgi:ankyrin repeat protein
MGAELSEKNARLLFPSIVIAAIVCLAPAHAAPPVCTSTALADLPSPGYSFGNVKSKESYFFKGQEFLTALFSMPAIQYPFGSLNVYGFDLTFVVGVDGKVECASVKPEYRATGPTLNTARKTFLENVSAWRFAPYVIDGKASRVVETFQIIEEELPRTHIDMPVGDPKTVTITQDVHPWLASFGPYHVELHGDGTAIYTSQSPDDPLGPQSYRVEPKAVTALVNEAKAADFWSLRDRYISPNVAKDDTSFERLNITLGGVTKSLTDHSEHESGIPAKAIALQTDVMAAAHIEFWQTPTLATLEQLRANGYDFHAKPAGRLLLQMTQKSDVKDDAILALLKLGAPQDAEADNPYTRDFQTLLEAAFGNGRTEVSAILISNGALLTDGKIDRDKVDAAFEQAVHSGKLAAVDQVLHYKPDMTYPDDNDPNVRISIILKLGDEVLREHERVTVAQRLLDLGADVNTRGSDGVTLLHKTNYDHEFALFLLQHGAHINAVDKTGWTPLARAMDEELALLLLTHGADPRIGETPKMLRFNIKNNHWTRVKTWIETRGFAEILVPQKGDD